MNYIKVSDAVDELSLAKRDYDRQDWLRNLILSKSVARDLKVKFLNDFKRVYLPINPTNNTVRLPFDNMRFRSISVIENCRDRFGKQTEKVIPLTLNPYINMTPQEPIKCSGNCNCEIAHPVCQELSDYTVIEEEIVVDANASPSVIGTRQTILRTCPNGDIIKEVTEPVQQWIEGTEVCDYSITMEQFARTVCDYSLVLTLSPLKTFFITFNINGINVTSPSKNVTTIQAYMESLGWTFVSNVSNTFTFTLNDTTDIYSTDGYWVDTLGNRTDFTIEAHCVQTTSINFPFTITSYTVNGETITPSPSDLIVYQSDLDDFFTGLGFVKIDDTHYSIEGSEDIYFNITVETSDSPSEEININFVQSGCRKPLINNGFQNQLFTDVLCNVTLKDCGCIEETASNISTIVQCCSPFLQCCQVGEMNNWDGWGFVPGCCKTNSEQPYNRFGTYNIDEKNFILYLDSVNASRVLLAYDSDGICDGEYYLPDYTINSLKAGMAWYSAQYDEAVSDQRRSTLKMNYELQLLDLQKNYTDPIRMADLINALKTRKFPY